MYIWVDTLRGGGTNRVTQRERGVNGPHNKTDSARPQLAKLASEPRTKHFLELARLAS